jgi:hydrogenase maturation factor
VCAIAEGSLLLTAGRTAAPKVLRRLKGAGIEASVIGRITTNRRKRVLTRRDGSVMPVAVPEQDPFWPAFFKGLEKA